MDPLTGLLIILGCLCTEAFFSGSEIGVVSADRMKLRHAAAKGSRGARLALKMLDKPEWLLSTTLIGTNIAVVTNTTVATAVAVELWGEGYSWVAILVAAPLVWIFGEIVAKAVFQQRADTLTPRVIFTLQLASWVFTPLLLFFSVASRLLARLVGGRPMAQSPFTLRREIVSMMEMPATHGDIHPLEQDMIRRVFDFSETTVRDIMTPLIDVSAVETGATAGEVIRHSVTTAHKRLPVYARRVDQIVGVVNVLDLLDQPSDSPITRWVRPPCYVPGSKSIDTLLVEFRQRGDRLAIIVDEFGGAEGLIAIEDIIEEVVGDIRDEYDHNEPRTQWARPLTDGEWLVSARIEIDRLAEEIGVAIPDGSYETLAGFLLEQARRIPTRGDVLTHRGVTYTIEQATDRAILEVRVKQP